MGCGLIGRHNVLHIVAGRVPWDSLMSAAGMNVDGSQTTVMWEVVGRVP